MTYKELREWTEDLCTQWGFDNVGRRPDYSFLVNYGYKQLCWDSECIHGPSDTESLVANQAEYTLTSPEWKNVLDCIVDDIPLQRINEHVLRRSENNWLNTVAGKPAFFWMVRPNVLRLYPTPSANGTDNMEVYGIRAPTALSADSDAPLLPEVYHEGIALRGAIHHCKKFARGDSRVFLADRLMEYQVDFVDKLKHEVSQNEGMYGERYVYPVEADRLVL